jgi:hypothetical protein
VRCELECMRLSLFSQWARWVGQCGHHSVSAHHPLESESPPLSLTTLSRYRIQSQTAGGRRGMSRGEWMRLSLVALYLAPCVLFQISGLVQEGEGEEICSLALPHCRC